MEKNDIIYGGVSIEDIEKAQKTIINFAEGLHEAICRGDQDTFGAVAILGLTNTLVNASVRQTLLAAKASLEKTERERDAKINVMEFNSNGAKS